eukprot:361684-Chlamydomonas_euryale.AAC.6
MKLSRRTRRQNRQRQSPALPLRPPSAAAAVTARDGDARRAASGAPCRRRRARRRGGDDGCGFYPSAPPSPGQRGAAGDAQRAAVGVARRHRRAARPRVALPAKRCAAHFHARKGKEQGRALSALGEKGSGQPACPAGRSRRDFMCLGRWFFNVNRDRGRSPRFSTPSAAVRRRVASTWSQAVNPRCILTRRRTRRSPSRARVRMRMRRRSRCTCTMPRAHLGDTIAAKHGALGRPRSAKPWRRHKLPAASRCKLRVRCPCWARGMLHRRTKALPREAFRHANTMEGLGATMHAEFLNGGPPRPPPPPPATDMLPEALADYAAVLRLNPACVDALYHTGHVYEKQSLLDAAIAAYSRVLELQPSNARAALSRGACYNMKGNIVRAIGAWFGAEGEKVVEGVEVGGGDGGRAKRKGNAQVRGQRCVRKWHAARLTAVAQGRAAGRHAREGRGVGTGLGSGCERRLRTACRRMLGI